MKVAMPSVQLSQADSSIVSPESRVQPAIIQTSAVPERVIREWRSKLVSATKPYERLQLASALSQTQDVSVLGTLFRLLPSADWQLFHLIRRSVVLNFERESYTFIADRLARQECFKDGLLRVVSLGQFEANWNQLTHSNLIEVLAILSSHSESKAMRSVCFKLSRESFLQQRNEASGTPFLHAQYRRANERSIVEYLLSICGPDSCCRDEVIDELLLWFEKRSEVLHRGNIRVTLRRIASNIGLGHLKKSIESDNPEERKRAIHLLGWLRGSRAEETLIGRYCMVDNSEKLSINSVLQLQFSRTFRHSAKRMADRNPDLFEYLLPLIGK